MKLNRDHIPSTVLTVEQLVFWCVAQLSEEQDYPTPSGVTFLKQTTESLGYSPSDTVQLYGVQTIDGGYRTALRVLCPGQRGIHRQGGTPWFNLGEVANGSTSPGLTGHQINTGGDFVRFVPNLGIVEIKLAGGTWTNMGSGTGVLAAWFGSNGIVYARVGTVYYQFTPKVSTAWAVVAETSIRDFVNASSSVRL